MKKDIFRIGVRVPDRELQTIEDVVQWFRTEQARQIEALVQGITEIVTAYSEDWAYVDAVNDGPEDQNPTAGRQFRLNEVGCGLRSHFRCNRRRGSSGRLQFETQHDGRLP